MISKRNCWRFLSKKSIVSPVPENNEDSSDFYVSSGFYGQYVDIEWGNSVVYGDKNVSWHTKEQDDFRQWLSKNGKDYNDVSLSCGYLPIGQVDLLGSFGSTDGETIWKILGNYLDIYSIEIDNLSNIFDYSWADTDYKTKQINKMKPGYDYSSSRG